MGVFDDIANWGWVQDVSREVLGTGQKPGIFGHGQYTPGTAAGNIPGYDAWQKQMQEGAAAAGGRAAPQLNMGNADVWRTQQLGLARQLTDQANGAGPSLANAQLQQATDRNMAQAMAMAQANPNNPGALRMVANQRAAAGQQAASDSATMRLQEQLQARNQLGQVLAGARGQDIGVASENAQLQGQQNALNQQAVQFYLGQGMSLAQAQQQAQLEMERLRLQGYLGAQGANQQFFQGMMGGLSGAAGVATGMGGGRP